MKSITQRLKKAVIHELHDPYFRAFLILFLIGVFVRLYRLDGFITFLGDQGRDAIILRRIVTFEHFPAVGAPSSVGGVFLGPFYYYFIAPWLLLFNFNPLGLAVGVALSSLVMILAIYFMTKDIFNRPVAFLTSSLFLFSGVIVEASRFSWNPNLLSYFSFVSGYFFIKAFRSHRPVFFFLAGLFIAFSTQLHYIMLAMGLPLGLWVLYFFVTSRKKVATARNILIMIGAFILGSMPLIIFDVRHGFLNGKNFIDTVSNPETSSSLGLTEIFSTFTIFNTYVFSLKMAPVIGMIGLILLAVLGVYSLRKVNYFTFFVTTFLLGLVVTSYFTGHKWAHYFGALYGYYFLIGAYVLHRFLWKGKKRIVLAVLLFVFMALQSKTYYFLFGTPNYQVHKARHLAEEIQKNVAAEKYHVTGVPDFYDDYPYRYFLEVNGKRPLAKDSLEKGTELFAICEKECDPLSAEQWSISSFGPKKIVKTWTVEGATIYKLVR